MKSFSSIQIVLVDAKYSMNIGSVARTMACTGFDDLTLVRPKRDWKNMDAIKYSLFGSSVLDKVKTTNDLSELKSTDSLLLGFSRRIGRRRSYPIALTELSDFVLKFGFNKHIKLVFGGEAAGLSTEDINICDHIVTIDKHIVSNSLSLPMAVAMVLYEIKRSALLDKEAKNEKDLFNNGQYAELYKKIRESLMKSGFVDNRDKRRVIPRLGDILKRLSLPEVRLVHSIIKKLSGE